MKRISIKVTPNSSKPRVEQDLLPDKHGNIAYKVYVAVPPEDGKANKAVIEIMAKFIGVPKSRISIINGLSGRNKILEIND